MTEFYKILRNLFFVISLSPSVFSQEVNNIKLRINPVFEGVTLQKGKWYVSKNGDSIKFKAIKFYISELEIEYKDDVTNRVKDSYYLIDVFKNTTLNKTFQSSHTTKLKSISFSLGVNENLNESGALSGDLDPVNGMYWAWQSGYINLKIEGESPSCSTRKNRFTFHIGGYKQPYQTLRKLRFPVKKNAAELVINIDVSKFMNDVSLKDTNSIMIPGEKAYSMMNTAVKMFSKD